MNFSLPTKKQLIHSAERVVGVFLVAVGGYLNTKHGFDSSTLRAALLAGLTAIYQLVLSTLTTL